MLTGQAAVVTGGSSGIGLAIARALAIEGARVGLVSRSASRLEEAVKAWPESACPAVPLVADLAHTAAVVQLADAIGATLGPVQLLIHSAGTIALGPFGELPIDSLDAQYHVNVRAPFLLTQRLLPSIIAARGQIVFVNSSAGLAAHAGVSQYAASKHALKAVADSLREEVHAHGVRVISVFPGRTATPMQEVVRRMEGRSFDPERYLRPGDVAAVVLQALTLPATAEVKDISIRPMRD